MFRMNKADIRLYLFRLKNEMKAKQEEWKTLEKPKVKPSDFFGVISKETAQKMISDIELSRGEWER
jgi:hypothetical protein